MQVAVYEGKAAVKYFPYFRKLFFLHPKTYELYGHVDVGWWPLGRILYPLYFKATIDASLLPGVNIPLLTMQLATCDTSQPVLATPVHMGKLLQSWHILRRITVVLQGLGS